jgi:hypothetical protein
MERFVTSLEESGMQVSGVNKGLVVQKTHSCDVRKLRHMLKGDRPWANDIVDFFLRLLEGVWSFNEPVESE